MGLSLRLNIVVTNVKPALGNGPPFPHTQEEWKERAEIKDDAPERPISSHHLPCGLWLLNRLIKQKHSHPVKALKAPPETQELTMRT